jgi:hypothetical protein
MDMNRAWLATGATALLAAAAFTLSVTQAGARDDHRNRHTNSGGAQHFRSGPAPTVQHSQSTPHVRSGPAPKVQHFQGTPHVRSGPAPTVRHFQGTPHVRSGPAPTVRHFESAPHFRSTPAPRHVESAPRFKAPNPPQVHYNGRASVAPQVHFNGGHNARGERHVRRHHRFRAPVINLALPYVYEPGYYADDECYVWQQALTPFGWRYIWMNVCEDEY